MTTHKAICAYIDFYNHDRYQKKLGCTTPAEFIAELLCETALSKLSARLSQYNVHQYEMSANERESLESFLIGNPQVEYAVDTQTYNKIKRENPTTFEVDDDLDSAK